MAHEGGPQFARVKTQASKPAGKESRLSEGLASAGPQIWTATSQTKPANAGKESFAASKLPAEPIWEAPQQEYEEATRRTVVQMARVRPEHEGDLPTPAIEIPHLRGQSSDEPAYEGESESGYFDQSHLSTYMSKHSSISFDPEVTIEDGDRQALEAPISKLSIKTRPRGRSMLEELQKRDMERQLTRARSEADREEYDSETGERLDDNDPDGRRDPRYVANEPRWPFLQSTVDELAKNTEDGEGEHRRHHHHDHSASLTSRTTASTGIEDVRTPDSIPQTHQLSPIVIDSPVPGKDFFGPSSAETPRRLASRSKSYSNERKSMRRMSRRSTSNTPHSPASTFLSRYFSHSPPVSPDGEGKEIGEYVLGRQIGFGGFSVIREASTIENGARVVRAVKIVRRQIGGRDEMENEALQSEYEHEVEIWRSLKHRHILPLYAVYVTDFATFAVTHLNTGGTLFDALRNNRLGLEPRLVRRYAYQVAAAIRYLHEDKRIVHRDIKLENCLIDISDPATACDGGRILVCDFGLADYIVEDDRGVTRARSPSLQSRSSNDSLDHVMGPSDTSTNFTGSLPYASPEMLDSGRPVLVPESDIWAYGVVCFAIITGKLPFKHAFGPRVRMMILNGEYDRTLLKARENGYMDEEGDDSLSQPIMEPTGWEKVGLETNGKAPCEEEPRPKETKPVMIPPELAGATQLVTCCMMRDQRRRWDVHQCLDSKWLQPEMDEAGRRPWDK